MADDVYYTYKAVTAIISDCRDDESVEDVRTVYGNDWVVVGMEIIDGEVADSGNASANRNDSSRTNREVADSGSGSASRNNSSQTNRELAWMLVPKYAHFPEDAYSGGTPNLKVSIDGHVYEKSLRNAPSNISAERARPHDDLHAMYGTAVPSDVDLEELRRLIDEEDCTLVEALERMETLQSRSGSQPEDSHECSYCGSKAAIEADGQVVKDCGTCDKRRYYEPIEGGDDD
jgi:hypothetical protein